MTTNRKEATPSSELLLAYHACKFGSKWGIVYRLNATTSFDQRVRYATKREATSMAALLNKEGI